VLAGNEHFFRLFMEKAVVPITRHSERRTGETIESHLRPKRWLLVEVLKELECGRQGRDASTEVAEDAVVDGAKVDVTAFAACDRQQGTRRWPPRTGELPELISIGHLRDLDNVDSMITIIDMILTLSTGRNHGVATSSLCILNGKAQASKKSAQFANAEVPVPTANLFQRCSKTLARGYGVGGWVMSVLRRVPFVLLASWVIVTLGEPYGDFTVGFWPALLGTGLAWSWSQTTLKTRLISTAVCAATLGVAPRYLVDLFLLLDNTAAAAFWASQTVNSTPWWSPVLLGVTWAAVVRLFDPQGKPGLRDLFLIGGLSALCLVGGRVWPDSWCTSPLTMLWLLGWSTMVAAVIDWLCFPPIPSHRATQALKLAALFTAVIVISCANTNMVHSHVDWIRPALAVPTAIGVAIFFAVRSKSLLKAPPSSEGQSP
jgi:hypothetical protein